MLASPPTPAIESFKNVRLFIQTPFPKLGSTESRPLNLSKSAPSCRSDQPNLPRPLTAPLRLCSVCALPSSGYLLAESAARKGCISGFYPGFPIDHRRPSSTGDTTPMHYREEYSSLSEGHLVP